MDSSLNAQGYAADAETGEIYVVSNGEICPLVLDGGKAAVGEGVNDLKPFVPEEFAEALLE